MEKLRQWLKIKEIVGSALERPPAERGAYLDAACSNDSDLRAEVESLLSAYDDTRGLPQSPWGDTPTDSEERPKRIGPYRLLKELGSGGMGQVWLAEQTEPVRRQVALKLIRAGMYDAASVQRFKAERQSLAIMDHPAIAKVFDAGTTSAGQSYLVMEYVDGVSVIDYCDEKKLGIRGRLQLFIRVCEGVQHAHQKAIIHRDLKPSNILVTEIDGKPLPRIIDFGLAKAAGPPIPGETQMTQRGAFLGTPGYMSPEQADLGCDIDTRTDVYSLGVILYELLSGLLPFDATELKKHPEEFVRRLRQDDPPRPSTKLSTNRETSNGSAAARGTDVTQLIALLRGDLDWIALKSLDRDRERRYATPLALASDLKNYLGNRPVTARAASIGYRARKYIRRHAAAVSFISVATVALVSFATLQTIEVRRITRERDRADRITEFMTRMFQVSNPSEARGNSITAREILDKASADIDAGIAQDPEARAQMMYVMGDVYRSLGLEARAQDLLTKAATSQAQVLGREDPRTLATNDVLAWILNSQGHSAQAESIERETLRLRRKVLGPEDPATISSLMHLADFLCDQSKFPEAIRLGRQAVELSRRVNGPDSSRTVMAIGNLAVTLGEIGEYEESEKLSRETLEVRTRLLGSDHPLTLLARNNLADCLQYVNKSAESERMLRPLIETERRILGPEHPDTIRSLHDLGTALRRLSRYAEAEKIQRENVLAMRRAHGAEQRDTFGELDELGITLYRARRYPEAERLFRELVQTMSRVLGPEHNDTLEASNNLANVLMAEGKTEEADQLEDSVTETRMRILGPNHRLTAIATYDYAVANALAGNKERALSLLKDALEHGLAAGDTLALTTDPDLGSLRSDPRFAVLIEEAKTRFTTTARLD
ncbi:MAG TPA: serine/threonine-protein kinase [Candidatus Sulfotelmatobacter sp.]|nr:serine/threonine-protein kinase [Candidatus Sulfotelmatobacter sp.]